MNRRRGGAGVAENIVEEEAYRERQPQDSIIEEEHHVSLDHEEQQPISPNQVNLSI